MEIDTAADTGSTTDADGTTHTTVGGIRTVLAPRPGPVTAGLLFRVGRADETLATSGITHLVEHLALHRHGVGDLHYNGATAATYTHFHVTGSPADVVEYLNGVCASLRDLPMDRLETEKEILRTEAAGKSHGPAHASAVWRYGSRSYGLTGYSEAGLPRITEHDVRDWARTWFTAANAVLWISSDTVPEGLDLTLPAGEWRPAPEATSALPATPAYFHGDEGGMVLTAVVPRSTEASLFAEVLGKELFRDLRQKGGYSYTATAEYCPRDTGAATVVAYADALPQKQDAMVGAFVDVLAKLRAGRIEQADLDAVRASALARLDAPELAALMLPGTAMNQLLRHRDLTVAGARAELEAVTVEDLHRVARAVWADALVQVPGRGLDWAGFTAAPAASERTVTGQCHISVEHPGIRLIVGSEGISLLVPDNQITVLYAECSLLQVYPDGARHLVGNDGFTLTVEPTLYGITAAELAPLDAAVPAGAVVRMPPRDPARIPRPNPADAPGTTWWGRNAGTVGFWAFGVFTVVLAVVTALLVVAETDREITPDGADWGMLRGFVLGTGACAVIWHNMFRKRRGTA
ncbi:insulinase family protein [Streptomyces sp. NPDC051183]|uniref:M16 family metallopeptidase n=1 Tax=unclassified Streptomyces TaxID=2593676 RepID=UPI0034169523